MVDYEALKARVQELAIKIWAGHRYIFIAHSWNKSRDEKQWIL